MIEVQTDRVTVLANHNQTMILTFHLDCQFPVSYGNDPYRCKQSRSFDSNDTLERTRPIAVSCWLVITVNIFAQE